MESRSTDIYAETLAVFDEAERPHEPRTTPEVAAALDCGRRAVYKRLETLADRGEVRTKKVGAGARVWWRTSSSADEDAELERYQRIIDALGDPVYELDEMGRFTYVNDAAVELSGYESDELLGESVAVGMADESIERISAIMRDLLRNGTGDSFTVEYEAETKGGERIPVENHIAILQDDEGRFKGSTGVIRDISEQRAREAEIDRTQSLLRNAERMGKVGGWELDVETESISWTEGTRRIHETPEDFEPNLEDGLAFFHPDDRETIASLVERCIETGEPYSEDLRLLTATGDERWVRAAGEALAADGETHRLRGYVQDITERVEREQELQRTTDLLDHAEHLANLGGWELNVSDPPYESIWTDAMFKIFDTEPQASMKPGDFLQFVHPEDRSRVARELGIHIDEKRGMQTEYRIRTDDGAVKWLRAFSEQPAERDDIVRGATLDITAQKARERDLERQRKGLAALNSLHETVRKITDAVIDQSSRKEIERAACEQLAASESYSFSWVADVDTKTGDITPRVEAGVDGYLDRADLSADSNKPRGSGPGGRAIETQEMQVSRNVFEDPSFEPWYDLAEEYDFSAVAAIPISYEGTVYGLLGLYTDRDDAFGETERRVVGQLGEILGHAIASVERKRALLSDDVVDIRLRVRDVFDLYGLDDQGSGSFTFDRTIPLDTDAFLVYGRATGDTADIIQQIVALPSVGHWDSCDVIGSQSDETRMQLRLVDPPVLSAVAAHGGHVRTVRFSDGHLSMELRLPADADTQQVVEAITSTDADIEMLARRQNTAPTSSRRALDTGLSEQLTERQRATIEASYYAGYFDWPRENSGEAVAESLGIGSSTFHQHIRRAEKKLLDELLDD